MGETVSSLFLLMFAFGLLSFMLLVLVSLFGRESIDGKVLLGLLVFASGGATGFAATWRFTVTSRRELGEGATPAPPPQASLDDLSSDEMLSNEAKFHDQWGYYPIIGNQPNDIRGGWRP